MQRFASPRLWIAAAAIVAIVLVVAAAIRLRSHPAVSPSASVAATSDPAMAAYRSRVNDDVNTLDVLEFHKLTCKTRDLCVSQVHDIRSATVTLLGDLGTTPAPPAVARQGAAVQDAAQQLLAQIDQVLSAMQQPDSDYVKLSAEIDLHPLETASAVVICWPGKVVINNEGESAVGYVCQR